MRAMLATGADTGGEHRCPLRSSGVFCSWRESGRRSRTGRDAPQGVTAPGVPRDVSHPGGASWCVRTDALGRQPQMITDPQMQRAAGVAGSHVHATERKIQRTSRPAVLVVVRVLRCLPGIEPCFPVPSRRRQAEHAMLLPTPSEVAAILGHCSDYFRPYVELCAFAGLRRGEAAAVKVEDVDFLGRKLHITRQRQRDAVRPPKYGSERTVSLPDDLLARLSAHVAFGVHPEGWLFIGERGPAGDNWGNHQFLKARRSADLNKVTLHSLRHFYASGLIAAGCDVVTVQRALGHASATTTLNTYSHLWPSAEDRTRSAAASIMAEVAVSADYLRTNEHQTHSHKVL